jgi:hypothetical protein
VIGERKAKCRLHILLRSASKLCFTLDGTDLLRVQWPLVSFSSRVSILQLTLYEDDFSSFLHIRIFFVLDLAGALTRIAHADFQIDFSSSGVTIYYGHCYSYNLLVLRPRPKALFSVRLFRFSQHVFRHMKIKFLLVFCVCFIWAVSQEIQPGRELEKLLELAEILLCRNLGSFLNNARIESEYSCFKSSLSFQPFTSDAGGRFFAYCKLYVRLSSSWKKRLQGVKNSLFTNHNA